MSKLKISDETNIERIEHKSKKNMAIGTIVGYLSILISIVHGLVLTPMIMEAVGVERYGLFGIATTIITLFLVDFGLTTTTETYSAKLRAAGDKEGVQRFLATVFKMYLTLNILMLIIIAVLYFIAPYMYAHSYPDPNDIKTLQTLLLIVGGYTLVSFPTSTFSGMITTYEKFGFNKFADLIQKAIYFVGTFLVIKSGLNETDKLIYVTVINISSFVTAIVIRYFYMRFYLGIKLDLRLNVSKSDLKSIFVFSAWGLIIAIGNRLVFNITPSILGIVSVGDQVSMFMLVNTIEGYVFMFGAMTGTFFMAKVARVEASGTVEEKRAKLLALTQKIGKLQFVVIGLILFGFAAVGQEFIQFWLSEQLATNPDFINIYWGILAICAYELVRIPELPFYNAMLTEGHIRPLAINTLIKATINISSSFILSYYFGAMGACISIATSRIIDLVLNNFAYKKYLGVSLSKFFSFIYIRGGITVAISFGVALLCHFFMPISNIIGKFMVDGIIFVLLYIICTLFITFTKDERHYYLNIIFEILHIKKRVEVNGVTPEVPGPFPEVEDLQKEESQPVEEEKKEETDGQD